MWNTQEGLSAILQVRIVLEPGSAFGLLPSCRTTTAARCPPSAPACRTDGDAAAAAARGGVGGGGVGARLRALEAAGGSLQGLASLGLAARAVRLGVRSVYGGGGGGGAGGGGGSGDGGEGGGGEGISEGALERASAAPLFEQARRRDGP